MSVDYKARYCCGMEKLEPERVLLAGDTHGNGPWVGTLCKLANQHGCDVILQLGDFGYWPHTAEGRRFLDQVDWHAERYGISCLYWIDGNHENHDMLAELEADEDGFVTIRDRCRYAPRGHRWRWGQVHFGALGGAFSMDHHYRIEGVSWWPSEILTDADVARLGETPLDVLLSHDAPEGAPIRNFELPPRDELLCLQVRERILQAVEATQPKLVVHGHWHRRTSSELSWTVNRDGESRCLSTKVEGLAADKQHDHRAWAILEVDPLSFIDSEAQVS